MTSPFYSCRAPAATVPASIVTAALLLVTAGRGTAEATQFVLLANGNVLAGTVEDRGPTIAIRDGDDEIRLNAAEVLCWAEGMGGLLQYRLEHRLDDSPLTIADDVEWCIKNELFELAAEQLAVLQARFPAYSAATTLEKRLRAVIKQRTRSGSDGQETSDHNSVPASGSESGSVAEPNRLSAIHQANVHYFAAKIQPILSNRCASAACHGGSRGTPPQMLKLLPKHAPTGAERRENLIGLLAYLDLENPESSALLEWALKPHGSQRTAPITPEDRALTEQLSAWIVAVTGDLKNPEIGTAHRDSDRTAAAVDKAEGRPIRLPDIDDPFDPNIFNRYYQSHAANRPPAPTR